MGNYTVFFNCGSEKEFPDFFEAVAFLKTVKDGIGSATLVGLDYDPGDSEGVGRGDGLTEAERAVVEAVIHAPVVRTTHDPEFRTRLDRIANHLAYQQSLEGYDPLEIVAAQLRMGWDK